MSQLASFYSLDPAALPSLLRATEPRAVEKGWFLFKRVVSEVDVEGKAFWSALREQSVELEAFPWSGVPMSEFLSACAKHWSLDFASLPEAVASRRIGDFLGGYALLVTPDVRGRLRALLSQSMPSESALLQHITEDMTPEDTGLLEPMTAAGAVLIRCLDALPEHRCGLLLIG